MTVANLVIFKAARGASVLPSGPPVSRLLFVVARTDSERYEWLQSAFAHDAGIEVTFDRRERDRRQRDVPSQVERRHRDRRVRDISYELRRLGYALIRREAPR